MSIDSITSLHVTNIKLILTDYACIISITIAYLYYFSLGPSLVHLCLCVFIFEENRMTIDWEIYIDVGDILDTKSFWDLILYIVFFPSIEL